MVSYVSIMHVRASVRHESERHAMVSCESIRHVRASRGSGIHVRAMHFRV
jgi:hypothetical protein